MRNLRICMGFLIGFSLISFNLVFSQSQSDVIKFSHKLHAENEVECETCHAAAAASKAGTDNLMPSMESCSDCHDVEEEKECTTCHSNIDESGEIPRIDNYSTLFSHELHTGSKIACVECHTGIDKKELVGISHLPEMKACMNCHSGKGASNQCGTCHTPNEQLMPVSHKLNFKHIHGQSAQLCDMDVNDQKKCSMCHTDGYCQNCHEGDNIIRNTHPLNFEFTHSFESRGKEQECMVCHTDRLYCVECHRQNHVMPYNHGVGWINAVPGDGGFHKAEAAMDLESCMVCHEANASVICQPCHGK